MRKSKIISAEGIDNFEAEMNKWLEENNNVKIISISYSSQHFVAPVDRNSEMHVYDLSALVVFEIDETGNLNAPTVLAIL